MHVPTQYTHTWSMAMELKPRYKTHIACELCECVADDAFCDIGYGINKIYLLAHIWGLFRPYAALCAQLGSLFFFYCVSCVCVCVNRLLYMYSLCNQRSFSERTRGTLRIVCRPTLIQHTHTRIHALTHAYGALHKHIRLVAFFFVVVMLIHTCACVRGPNSCEATGDNTHFIRNRTHTETMQCVVFIYRVLLLYAFSDVSTFCGKDLKQFCSFTTMNNRVNAPSLSLCVCILFWWCGAACQPLYALTEPCTIHVLQLLSYHMFNVRVLMNNRSGC